MKERVLYRFLQGSDRTALSLPDSRITECVESIEKALRNIKHHMGKDPNVRPYEDISMEFNSIRGIADVMARRVKTRG